MTFNTSKDAGRYSKSLLPANDYLDRVHKKTAHIREMFHRSTLPWGKDGTMLLPTAKFLDFMTEFRKEKDEWLALVQDFVQHYDELKMDAQRVLGGLYTDSDYPSKIKLLDKFKIDIDSYHLPSTDFRTDIASDELTRIQQAAEARIANAQAEAMREVWTRLYDRVKHMADKLSDPNAIFRDALIDNLKDQCSMLSRLNFMDDPNLESLRQQVEETLASHHPDALRNDPELRRDTAAEAKAIFMGA